jgi:hypothetical protein
MPFAYESLCQPKNFHQISRWIQKGSKITKGSEERRPCPSEVDESIQTNGATVASVTFPDYKTANVEEDVLSIF